MPSDPEAQPVHASPELRLQARTRAVLHQPVSKSEGVPQMIATSRNGHSHLQGPGVAAFLANPLRCPAPSVSSALRHSFRSDRGLGLFPSAGPGVRSTSRFMRRTLMVWINTCGTVAVYGREVHLIRICRHMALLIWGEQS